MRRKLLKVLALTAVFSFSSALNIPLASAAENAGSGALQALGESDTEVNDRFTMGNQQKEAQKAYAELMEAMNDPQFSFKEYYGGAYVGDDNILVVNVTTQSDTVKKEIQEITKAQNVKFKEVTYSYKQLMDLYETISDKMENSNLKEKINCFYVDETNNRVVVEVLDDKIISSFNQEILFNEAVTFNVVKEAISNDVAVNAPAAEFDIEGHVLLAAHGDEEEITVPSGVTEIADRAFAGNKSVTRIYIPEGVVSIGAYAFKGCSSLDVVLLPSTIESIGDGAFKGCKELLMVGYVAGTKKSVINWLIDNEMQYQLYSGEQDGDVAFNSVRLIYPQLNEIFSKNGIIYKVVKKTKKNMAVVVSRYNKNRKTFKIPGSVTFKRKTYKVTGIAKSAFKGQPKLQKVVAGANVNKIEDSAFVKCKRLSLLIIKNKECKYSGKIVKKSGKCKIKVAG